MRAVAVAGRRRITGGGVEEGEEGKGLQQQKTGNKKTKTRTKTKTRPFAGRGAFGSSAPRRHTPACADCPAALASPPHEGPQRQKKHLPLFFSFLLPFFLLLLLFLLRLLRRRRFLHRRPTMTIKKEKKRRRRKTKATTTTTTTTTATRPRRRAPLLRSAAALPSLLLLPSLPSPLPQLCHSQKSLAQPKEKGLSPLPGRVPVLKSGRRKKWFEKILFVIVSPESLPPAKTQKKQKLTWGTCRDANSLSPGFVPLNAPVPVKICLHPSS